MRKTRLVWWSISFVAVALVLANVRGWLFSPSTVPPPESELADDSELAQALPKMDAPPSFASSESCRTCHPQEYASWHASYHRQMTQVARVETVLGPFDGTTVEDAGLAHRLVRRGDELWVESSPLEGGDAARVGRGDDTSRDPGTVGTTARRVIMTTGAHHMQLCWTKSGKGNLLDELPVIYIRDERPSLSRWAPLEASYLSPSPPGAAQQTHWNRDCILCHATGGKPGLDHRASSANTRVADLGIACEACHGPAERHVRLHRDHAAGGSAEPGTKDDVQAIINPARLRPERSAQVCGHCHALASFQTDQLTKDFFHSGSPYRPGDDLLQTRMTVLPAHMSAEQIEAHRRYNPFFDGSYWPDGMARVAGREYNGLLESACYQK
ncbi:MAG TPA: multiheme c-type cytochrome, partial [Pirellulales bacterium]|nr:multiheme c-type cytochrome [Pirellulales bacterium]